MLDIVKLIRDLEFTKNPSPALDRQIAEIIGWQRIVRKDVDDNGRSIGRGVWYDPTTGKPGTIPRYTSDLDAAHSLISVIAPNSSGGCSWEPDSATVRIADGQFIPATTPALALCAAAMRLVYFKNVLSSGSGLSPPTQSSTQDPS